MGDTTPTGEARTPTGEAAGPVGRVRGRGGSRAARVALLLAVDAALVAVLWFVAAPRLFGTEPRAEAPPPAAALGQLSSERDLAVQGALLAVPDPATAIAVRPAMAVAPPRNDRALEARLRRVVAEAERKAESLSKGRVRAADVTVAVHVRDAASGAEIAALSAERLLRPASNLKLVTSTAALTLLGPDWAFETLFTSQAPLEGGVLRGDLVVRAGGDPLYDPAAAGDVAALLAPVLRELKAAGVRRVEGDLVLDEGRYLAPGPGPAWPSEGQRWSEYCALAGGMNANAGCITARVTPGRAGAAARVEALPRGHGLAERIDVRTGAAGSPLDVRVSAVGGTVVVQGSVPAGLDAREYRFAAPDPVALFGNVLLHELRRSGVEVTGSLRRERVPPAPASRPLARLRTPLASVLTPINAHSNNVCADQLFLALGQAQFGRGDREGGRRATSLALERLGVPDDGFAQVDGSGLSRDNRVSARQITALLAGALRRGGRAATLLLDSMAAPHADGTLDGRMAGLEERVRAKTGFIAGTSALSGVIDAEGGGRLVFSILVEYPNAGGLNTSVWKPMEDEICRILAGARG